MTIKRYGTEQKGAGGRSLPFARAVEADGWLHVSGQVAMEDGEIIDGGIIPQTHKAIGNLIAVLEEANYGPEHVVRVGVWLDDPRDFWSFNKVYQDYFSAHPPARSCVQSSMMVDCKVEIDCVAYKQKASDRSS
jgi:reactive intermediate/imine deaminase